MFAPLPRWRGGGCAAAGLAVITRRLRLSGLHTAQGCQSDQARAHGRPPDGMGWDGHGETPLRANVLMKNGI